MKLMSINLGNFASTGRIMTHITHSLQLHGNEAAMAYPSNKSNVTKDKSDLIIGSKLLSKSSLYAAILTGYNGCFSFFSTAFFLKKLDQYKPDLLHLHNLHHSYINLPMLFRYIKKRNIPVVWTLHDCWAFTGQCPYFTIVKCGKWKTGCYDCPQYRQYPESYVDRTKTMYRLKKKWFTGVKNMTIVTPSEWLGSLVKQSFLNNYPVKVINNGIDLSVFKPTESKFREKYNIPANKIILLGVAFGWGERKGLDVFIELSKRLNTDYQIVLVGTDNAIGNQLPNNIISIPRTQNQKELAEIYTAADLFVNPTREENYPTVNMEALACGTPVVTFNTGGSPEILNEDCGMVVPYDDIDALTDTIKKIQTDENFSFNACVTHAEEFNMKHQIAKYIDLYESILKSKQ